MFLRNERLISLKPIIEFSFKNIINLNKKLISTLMKSTNISKKKEKISIEYEQSQAKSATNTKRVSESQKRESIYDSKMSLAETLLKDKSNKIKNNQ